MPINGEMMCELSIIIPVYNKEKYLEETIDAILAWDNTNYELILINDGSTDNSGEIIHKYSVENKHISSINLVNGGVSRARNVGIKHAIGKWLWFIDADDLPCMTFAEEFFSCQEKNFDVYCGDYVKVYKDKTELVHNPQYDIMDKESLYQSFRNVQYQSGYYGYLWNKIIKSDVVKKNNIEFNEKLVLAEDLDFMVKVYSVCDYIKTTEHVAMYYKVEADNNSSQKKIDYFSQLNIQLLIKEWFKQSVDYETYEGFLKENVTKYAAYVLFYAAEDNANIRDVALMLIGNEKIKKSLVYWNDPSVMGKIANYLYEGKIFKLVVYLKVRKFIRKFYRLLN